MPCCAPTSEEEVGAVLHVDASFVPWPSQKRRLHMGQESRSVQDVSSSQVCLAPILDSCNPPSIFNPVGVRAENRPWQRSVFWAGCVERGDDVTVGSMRTQGRVSLGERTSTGEKGTENDDRD